MPDSTPATAYVEEPAFLVLQIVLTALQPLTRLPMTIDRDSDFLLTGIHGTSTGGYKINFRTPSGRTFANNQIQNVNLVGVANQPTPIGPPLAYAAASTGPMLDITDTSNANNTVELIFSGIRRLRTAA
jgi:hypothetical protein